MEVMHNECEHLPSTSLPQSNINSTSRWVWKGRRTTNGAQGRGRTLESESETFGGGLTERYASEPTGNIWCLFRFIILFWVTAGIDLLALMRKKNTPGFLIVSSREALHHPLWFKFSFFNSCLFKVPPPKYPGSLLIGQLTHA